MLLRLSRLSLGLAAASGALALLGPAVARTLWTDVALALAAVAFTLWRAAVAQHRRREHPADAVPEPVSLGATLLLDAEALVQRRVAEAATFEAALHGAAATLRGEIGARTARVFLVHSAEDGAAVSELIAAQPGFRTPPRAVPLDASVLGRALREQRPCIDLPHALAVPVLADGGPVALLELLGIDMMIDEQALAQLLAATQQALGDRNRTQATLRAPIAPPTQPFARSPRMFGVRSEAGGCA